VIGVAQASAESSVEKATPAPSTRTRAVAGATWTLVGHGAQQALRFGSNLVLTRLLAPEAFGLMALVFIFVTGLEMLSDVGVGPAIIQSKRGDDPRLLDTAWTVQIVRGLALGAVSLAIAWPASRIYAEPRLTALVAAAGVGIVIRGFTPTRVHSLNRKVVLGRITAMELLTQASSIALTIAAAWLLRSPWALLLGAVFGDLLRVVLSYRMLPGHPHRLRLDRESVGEIVRIGRWVFFSTAVTFAAGNLDRLIMGRLVSVSDLGVYAIAGQIVVAIPSVGRMIGSRVLFPLLAETARESPERMYPRLLKARAAWILPTVAALLVLATWGDVLIALLYRREFHDAGWMVRIFAAGAVVTVVNQSAGVLWPALGEFRTTTLLMIVQVALMVASVVLGHAWFGVVGFCVGTTIPEVIMLPIQSFLLARRRLWQPELELPVLVAAAVAVGVGALLR
jgi:O-antigen/teichoic acid export membrane protein